MGAIKVGRVGVAVQVRRNRSREAGDDLLAGDEPIPLVVGPSRIGVSVPVVAAAGEKSALVFCPVDGDGLAGDVALPVQVIPRYIDQDDAVANKQGLVSVLDLYPLELIRLRAGSVSEGIVRHAAGHRRNVASRRRAVICIIVTPRLCGPFENRAVVVEAAELDGSEILRHKGSLLPF